MGLFNRIGEWNKRREEQARQRRDEEEKLRQQRIKQLSDFEDGKLPVDITNSSIVLKRDEVIHKTENVNLYEPRSVRNYGGGSIRVARGVRIHTGQAESHLENRKIDSGSLILTNQRLIFIGSLRTTNMNLGKILNVIPFEDGFQINRDEKNRPESFSSKDSEIWIALLKGAIKNLKECKS